MDQNNNGCVEFNGSQNDLTNNRSECNLFVNGVVEKVYADGHTEIVFTINENGEYCNP